MLGMRTNFRKFSVNINNNQLIMSINNINF